MYYLQKNENKIDISLLITTGKSSEKEKENLSISYSHCGNQGQTENLERMGVRGRDQPKYLYTCI